MLRSPNNYEFRKALLQVHTSGLRDASATPTRGELVLCDEAHLRWKIRQVNYMLDVEMGYLKKCRKFSD